MAEKKNGESVQVAIRCRPLSKDETKNNNSTIVHIDPSVCQVRVQDPKAANSGGAAEGPKIFTFDLVFPQGTEQKHLYDNTCRVIVDSVLQGYNGTVFAYGQTGTGKTHTMEGVLGDEGLKGVTPRTFDQLFQSIDVSSQDVKYLVRASFIQIYNDAVLDLLGKDTETKHDLKQNAQGGVYVDGIEPTAVNSVDDLNHLLNEGKKARHVGGTAMNAVSSRSHCIFQIIVETCILNKDGSPGPVRMGKLNLVDLAGSERIDKTGAEGDRRKEGININKSLTALGNVIAALTSKKKQFVPYRDSKLTRLLQDSLGGNTRTVMIANIGPADYNFEETISTLRFADRAKNIKNKPKINEDPKDAKMREYQEEIAKLRALLEADGGMPSSMSSDGLSMTLGAANGLAPLGPRGTLNITKIVEKTVMVGVTPEKFEEMKKEAEAKKAAARAEAERTKELLKSGALSAAQAAEIAKKTAAEREAEVIAEREKRRIMKAQLEAMETKLLMGAKIIDDAKRQKIEAERKEAEAERLRIEHQRGALELAQKEELQLDLKAKYENVTQALQAKSKKLEKLRSKYQEIKRDVEDAQSENQREREELLETIRDLSRNIQLKDMILSHFVPKVEANKVERRAFWNDDKDDWMLREVDYGTMLAESRRPPTARAGVGVVRPVTDLARLKVAMGDGNPRYRPDNILDLDLDMPHRTTQDYDEHRRTMEANGVIPPQQHQQQHVDDGYYGGAAGARPSTATRRY